jgi:hypothetical protein
MSFYVLDVVQFRGKRVGDVDHDHFPVSFTLIEKCHDTENLDLLDLTGVSHLFADLTDIERIVVALGLGLSMRLSGVLPGLLSERSEPSHNAANKM